MRPRMLEPVLIEAPLEYPVTLAEAKDHLRVDGNDNDSRIAFLIAAATRKLDGWNGELGRCLLTQSWRLDFDRFPRGRRLRLPSGPVQSIGVAYFDTDNVTQVLAGSKYHVHEDALGTCLDLADPEPAWPSVYRRRDGVRITIVAGYGTPDDVPEPIKQVILLIVGHWFANREAVTVGNHTSELPLGVAELLVNYRYPSCVGF